MSSSLKEWKDKKILVLTGDGRIIVGLLIGYDQVQNLILSDTHERLYSTDADVEEEPLGLYLVRGDNICLIGECDEQKLSTNQRAPFPIAPIQQQQF
ncbi:hypothetical protein ACA910_002724 [Epithemia clementina (nom. ined.)]